MTAVDLHNFTILCLVRTNEQHFLVNGQIDWTEDCKYGLELPSCAVVINPHVTQQIGCWTFDVVREMWSQITHVTQQIGCWTFDVVREMWSQITHEESDSSDAN